MTLLNLDLVNQKNALGITINPPSPVGIEKRAGQFTWSIFIQAKNYGTRHSLLSTFQEKFNCERGISLKLDVDPIFYL